MKIFECFVPKNDKKTLDIDCSKLNWGKSAIVVEFCGEIQLIISEKGPILLNRYRDCKMKIDIQGRFLVAVDGNGWTSFYRRENSDIQPYGTFLFSYEIEKFLFHKKGSIEIKIFKISETCFNLNLPDINIIDDI